MIDFTIPILIAIGSAASLIAVVALIEWSVKEEDGLKP